MIPKKIHYCWFGRNEKPKSVQACINSWKKYCPDYEIIEWNEDNFNVNYNSYTRFCYQNGKWAFLSDLARLIIVKEHGGLYFDTDVEVVKKLDELIKCEAFYGFETPKFVATGLGFGAIPHHATVESMIRLYEELKPDKNGIYPLISCPQLNTKALIPYGLELNGKKQIICGALILPVDYMNPYDDPTGKLRKTKNTISIHWYSKSWMSRRTVLRSKLTKPFHRLFGNDCFRWLKK